MAERIGLAQARILLDAALHTKGPDFVYNPQPYADRVGCLNVPYTDDLADMCAVADSGAPAPDSPKRLTGCLVGTALSLGGVPVHECPTSGVVRFENHLTPTALAYLRTVQRVQDQGASWGMARDVADIFIRELAGRLADAGVDVSD